MRLVLRSALISLAGLTLGGLALAPEVAADGDVMKRADSIAKKVSKLRGLKRKKPINRGVMDKQQIRKRLIERVDQEFTPAELQAEELALKRLRMLAVDADYKQLVIDLMTEQIAGFYDPIDQKLYIAKEQQTGKGGFNDILMAHEIDHALQDQHFDLQRFMKPSKGESDSVVARQALVEGDGTALMFEFMMSKMGMDMPWADSRTTDAMIDKMSASMTSGKGKKIPLVLREGMIFPYMAGLGFVAHFRQHHPWKRVDAMYKKPPLSTEHILHPEKYLRYERPDTVTIGKVAALSEHQLIHENVNGEFGLSLILRQHAPGRGQALRTKAARATRGWGGDRLGLYTPTDHNGGLDGTVAILYTVWDGPADAIEFFEMLSDSMGSLSGSATEVASSDQRVEYRNAQGQAFLAERKDDRVVIALGVRAEMATAILQDVWKKWKVRRR